MPLSHRKLTNRSLAAALLLFPILLIARLALGVGSVNAQTPSPTPAPIPSPQVADVTRPAPAPSPKVILVVDHLELDEIIQVQVEHFTEWAATHDATKLVPFLNGRAVRGNYPEEIHPDRNRLHFHLEIKPKNKELWTDLLGAPRGLRHPVTFTIGLENESPFDSVYDQSNPLPLTVISPVYGVVGLLVVLFTLVLFTWLARTTNLIREPGEAVPGKLRPYNLGRTQMAFWFFLVYVSYTVIWLITDSLDTITPSLLGLMGISAGTALSEALIDSGKDKTSTSQLQDLISEKQALETGIPELQSQIGALNAKPTLTPEDTTNRDSLNKQLLDSRTRLGQVNQQLQTINPASTEGHSQGLLRDILRDGSGYSFHRFQIFAWTIVLGIIFVSSVYNNLSMPEFSTTLLGLMGISSGTYIGFKFPEKK
jgi:hypothetical protein